MITPVCKQRKDLNSGCKNILTLWLSDKTLATERHRVIPELEDMAGMKKIGKITNTPRHAENAMLIAESEKDMKNMFYNVKKIRADEEVWNWMAKNKQKTNKKKQQQR